MDELFNGTVATGTEAGATPAKAGRAGKDLSSEIEQAVAREPHDRVRCVRVFDDYYRCNWWAPNSAGPGAAMAEWERQALHRVRKSRFINARQDGEELIMQEVETVAR